MKRTLPLHAMRWLVGALALAALIAVSVTAWSRSSAGVAEPPLRADRVAEASAAMPIALERHIDAVEDRDGTMTLADVRGLAANRWTPTGAHAPNFSFDRSVWWLRVRLGNASAEPVKRVLELTEPMHDYLDVYALAEGAATPLMEAHTGDRRPFATRGLVGPAYAFEMKLPAHGTVDVYLRLQNHDGVHDAVPLRLWEPAGYHVHAGNERLVHGLYYGALLVLLVYNLFLFASTRDGLFGRYVMYLAVFFVWNFSFRGLAFQYVWPDQPWWQNQVIVLSSVACYVTLMRFSWRFLDLPTQLPRFYRALKWWTVLIALTGIPALFGVYAASWWLLIPISMAAVTAVAASAVVLARRGSRPARTWLLAWTCLALTVPLYYARMIGVVPPSFLTEQGMQIGSALEFVLLAFGLADRMNQMKAEKLAAEQAATEAKTALAQRLEVQVRERTQELEAANERLVQMAITDELTGAFNRRHFNETFGTELGRRERDGVLALALLDVDHFKVYNDTYGHPQGDKALKAVSAVARGLLRRSSDRFFRVGGEEFALLIEAEHADHAIDFVDTLRETIARLGMPHKGSSYKHVSVSVGVVVLPPDTPVPSTSALYARADALLYRAKQNGRNRVVSEVLNAALPTQAAAA